MEVNIKQWNKYKDRIADEEYGRPFDWTTDTEKLHIIYLYKLRVENGFI